jgi:gentisate 1,2-dioxygenase
MPVCQTYESWMAAQGVPIYREYYIEDVRTMKLEPWSGRECHGALLQMEGQEGVVEARVIEIPPGKTLPPLKMGVDEAVYITRGQGMAAVWATADGPRKTFEWGPHSLFLVPHHCWYQLSNMSGTEPARVLHYNYLPLALAAVPDPDFFINNPYEVSKALPNLEGEEFYSQARAVEAPNLRRGTGRIDYFWAGNFFPDMRAWDKLSAYRGRGAGGRVIFVKFPTAELEAHMSVFPARTYKKGHRHGPGVFIIIPAGEGYSLMWKEGSEDSKVVVPWHEGSMFVPPNRWFHQHFNLGSSPARYLAFHAPPQLMRSSEKPEDLKRDQIEYPDEDPWNRQKFQEELATRGLSSLMPEQAYKDPTYEWGYEDQEG